MLWPEAVFEDVEGHGPPRSYGQLAFARLRDVFAYRDFAAAAQWKARGAAAETANTMIHLLKSSTTITVVVDDPRHPDMTAYLALLESGLPA
ncbi:MAG: hypothetical protein KY476_03305 [Planctomycetes bacterium]|nr:hypothetical protein [Planctomycetota bacterium]